MELVDIPERYGWRERFAALGLAGEAENWRDDIFAVTPMSELKAVVASAESVSARMKGVIEKCFTEPRLKYPWTMSAFELAATKASFSTRHQIAVQRLDYVRNREGWYALAGVEVDPLEGFLSCALMQWLWIEEHLAAKTIPSDCDQFNRLNETMLSRVRRAGADGRVIHAIFDIADSGSAAMAGYMVNLGIQSNAEVRPLHHANIALNGNAVSDPSGTPIKLCWRTRFPGQSLLFSSPLYRDVEFTTPAWYRFLPDLFRSMGELEGAGQGESQPLGRQTLPILSVWMVNAKAVACSCSITEISNPNIRWNVPHVVR